MKTRHLQPLKLALIQMRCEADLSANLDSAVQKIREAAGQGAQVICLPELFRSHYFCQVEDPKFFDWAESIPGPTTEVLAPLAKELKITLVASLFECRAPGLYHNTTVTFSPEGKMIGKYRKMHIPDDPSFYEKFYFTPGDLGFQNFATPAGNMGALICWDQWYPEAARLTALRGAQVLFYPTAIGWLDEDSAEDHVAQHDAWQTIQRSHAIANGVFVAAVNRIGREGPTRFWGASFVADPLGRILAQASHDQEETLIVDIDLSMIAKTRQLWPFLRDRRIESYSEISKRFLEE